MRSRRKSSLISPEYPPKYFLKTKHTNNLFNKQVKYKENSERKIDDNFEKIISKISLLVPQ